MYIVSKYFLQNIIKYKRENSNFRESDTNLGVETAHHMSWDKWKLGAKWQDVMGRKQHQFCDIPTKNIYTLNLTERRHQIHLI